MSFEQARLLADAVLFEGYALYPYRASAPKNLYRWTFGVLAPREWSEAGGCEPCFLEAQVLVQGGPDLDIRGALRFLQVQRRTVERAVGGREGAFTPAASLEVDGRLLLPWEEGVVREIDFGHRLLEGAPAPAQRAPFLVPGGLDVELARGEGGAVAGRILRQRLELRGRVHVAMDPLEAARPLWRLTVRVENETPWPRAGAAREEVMIASCASTHLLLEVEGGAFLSSQDPPEWANEAAREAKCVRTWPVLASPPGRRDLLLCAPFILYDHAQVAPESPQDLFDATEIDELLTLRTRTLTEEEKRLARATDARAAALLDRADALSEDALERLHGASRDLSRDEMVPRKAPPARGSASALAPGSRVRLKASARRTDAQDLLFVGMTARVEKVLEDLDGQDLLAVTLEEDPGRELRRSSGRFHYYYPDEVEPLPPSDEAAA